MAASSRSRPAADGTGSGRGLFVFFFIGGGLLILLMKSLTDSGFLAVMLPVVLMGSYALMLVEWPGWRPRHVDAGDNFYYLGFLYTLISLAISLYQFNAVGATGQIITNFGLALTSTILGLAGRILLSQPNRDADGIERRAREDLAQANRRLRAEMEYSLEEFQQARKETARLFEELNQRLTAAGDGLARATSRLEQGVTGYASVEERIADLNAAASLAEQAASGLNEVAQAHRRSAAANAGAADGFQGATEALLAVRGHLAQDAEQSRLAVAELSGIRQDLNQATAQLVAASRALQQVLSRLASDGGAGPAARGRPGKGWGLW